MNELHRPFVSVMAAAGAVSLENVSFFFSTVAAIVAIIAGLPTAIKTTRRAWALLSGKFTTPDACSQCVRR